MKTTRFKNGIPGVLLCAIAGIPPTQLACGPGCEEFTGEYVSFLVDTEHCPSAVVSATCVGGSTQRTDGGLPGGLAGVVPLFVDDPWSVFSGASTCVITGGDQEFVYEFEISREAFDDTYDCGETVETVIEITLDRCDPPEDPET